MDRTTDIHSSSPPIGRYVQKFVKELSQQVLDKTSFLPEQISFFPGAKETNQFEMTLAPGHASSMRWRVCVTAAVRGEVWSIEQEWSPTSDFSPATVFTLPPDMSQRAVAIARYGNGFVLAARGPNAICQISADGTIGVTRPIEGEPVHASRGRRERICRNARTGRVAADRRR